MVPQISFVVPTKNRVEWLPECLMGLFAQTVDDIEIVIVNDGSDDGTKEFLDDWAAKDTRAMIIHNKDSVGAGMCRNIGMYNASSEIIAVCDDDDCYPDGRAQVTLDYFKEHPESTLVNFPYIQVGYCNEEIEKFYGKPFDHDLYKTTGAISYFANPTCAYKKSEMIQIGGYPNETEAITDDAQMVKKWVDAGNKIDFYDKYFLCFHRVLPKSMMVKFRGFDSKWVTGGN